MSSIEDVPIKEVWPKEDRDFTPWLKDHIEQLDRVLGVGLSKPESEVEAGAFKVDLVAESDVGDVVIENQYGATNHTHLGQLVTYLSEKGAQGAIWIVERTRPEHVKAVQKLNDEGFGQIWLVTVRAIQIGGSAIAPLFTVAVEPPEVIIQSDNGNRLTETHLKKESFLASLHDQSRENGISSPFMNLKPSPYGTHRVDTECPGLVYRVTVNRKQSRVAVTNTSTRETGAKWTKAYGVLKEHRDEIKAEFAKAGLKSSLDWGEVSEEGTWAIRYLVDVNYTEPPNPDKLLELNRAAEAMKKVFDPRLAKLDPRLEDDSDES